MDAKKKDFLFTCKAEELISFVEETIADINNVSIKAYNLRYYTIAKMLNYYIADLKRLLVEFNKTNPNLTNIRYQIDLTCRWAMRLAIEFLGILEIEVSQQSEIEHEIIPV